MWLFITQGFYSVVEDRGDSDRVLVRARAREDLEALKEQIAELQVQETPEADYHWRAFVTRDQWVEAVEQLAGQIDYGNFKDTVAARQGHDRDHLYSEVWGQSQALEEKNKR